MSIDPAALASSLAEIFREKQAHCSKGCCGCTSLKSISVPGPALAMKTCVTFVTGT